MQTNKKQASTKNRLLRQTLAFMQITVNANFLATLRSSTACFVASQISSRCLLSAEWLRFLAFLCLCYFALVKMSRCLGLLAAFLLLVALAGCRAKEL